MDRRDFVKRSILTWGASALEAHLKAERIDLTKSGGVHPEYIRESIPDFTIPTYRGDSYEDNIPDTLDLAERARLGVHVLTSIADPHADYEIYWGVSFDRNPAVVWHDFNDWVQNQEGLMEALPLLRTASGSDLDSQVDQAWMKSILKSIGPDGLCYVPLDGRPWSRLNASGVDPVWLADGRTLGFQDSKVTQISNTSTCQRIISTVMVYYLRDRNPMWKATARKMIERLSVLAIERPGYCYYPAGSFEPGAKLSAHAKMPIGSTWGTSWNSRLIQGLAQYHKVTGDEKGLQLAGKLTRYTRYHGQIFTPEGLWLVDPEAKDPHMKWPPSWEGDRTDLKYGGHGSGHGLALLSVMEYATSIQDRDLMEFCRNGFEWAKNPGPHYGVSNLVGWFPEVWLPRYRTSEGCAVGLMLSLAVKLSYAGVGDYWDDVDRWTRNHFAEAQLTNVDWVHRIASQEPKVPVAWNESADHAAERNIGAFAGSATGNDWGPGTGHCCTGNCTRAIYYVWDSMLIYEDRRLQLNLLLNRASRWADVYSYIPYQGRVDLKIKQPCHQVRVRAPEWIQSHNPELKCTVNGRTRLAHWEGRYLILGAANSGDVVSITFPIQERTVQEQIGSETYTLTLKGNTVVSIDPPGRKGSLYQGREKYRQRDVRWLRVNRFVPEKEIHW